MAYSDYIKQLKQRWIGKTVSYQGEQYKVVDVDYNGILLIDKPARFTTTTAVATWQLDRREWQ